MIKETERESDRNFIIIQMRES